MSRTDFSYINYGVSEKDWNWIQEKNLEHLNSNPVCEICRNNPSVRITGLGTIKACCEECNENIYKQIEEDIKLSRLVDEEYRGY